MRMRTKTKRTIFRKSEFSILLKAAAPFAAVNEDDMNMDARTVEGKEKSRHFLQWVHRANLWGRKEGRNGVQKLPKRQDELVASSFLKKKHNANS